MKARSSPALPGCRIQLELVEDKLRELRLLTLDPREYDDKTVTLSQLDRVRQELLATAKGELKYVTFGKVRSRRMLRKPSSAHERPRQCPQLVWSSDASPSARRAAAARCASPPARVSGHVNVRSWCGAQMRHPRQGAQPPSRRAAES